MSVPMTLSDLESRGTHRFIFFRANLRNNAVFVLGVSHVAALAVLNFWFPSNIMPTHVDAIDQVRHGNAWRKCVFLTD